MAVAAVAIAAFVIVVVAGGDEEPSSAVPERQLVDATLDNLRSALPALGHMPEGWLASTDPSAQTFYALVALMSACGVDTSGAASPRLQVSVAYAPPPDAEGAAANAGIGVTAIAMADAAESQRLLEVGREAAECVAEKGTTGGLTVTVQPDPELADAEGTPLALQIEGVPMPTGTTTVYAVAATAGPFGVAALGPSVDEASRWVEHTLGGLHR